MAKKIRENWLKEVFKGKEKAVEHYGALSDRELAVVAGSVLELALGDLLMKRLAGSEEARWGLVSQLTFERRVQLALAVGLITDADAKIINGVKNLRNIMAHHVNVTFERDEVQQEARRLLDAVRDRRKGAWPPSAEKEFQLLKSLLNTSDGVAAIIITALLTTELRLKKVHKSCRRVRSLWRAPKTKAQPTVSAA